MTDIAELRTRLDEVDRRILNAIAARFDVIRAIAEYKRVTGMPMMQPARVTLIQDKYAEAADRVGIPAERLREIAVTLIAAACDLENHLMSDASERTAHSGR